MHVYLARSYKEMHMDSDMFGLSNTKPYAGMHSCIMNDDVASLPPHILLRWWAYHLRTWLNGLVSSHM